MGVDEQPASLNVRAANGEQYEFDSIEDAVEEMREFWKLGCDRLSDLGLPVRHVYPLQGRGTL